MAEYVVNHRYASSRDGQKLGPWRAGQRVRLDPADAAWINHDSPGALSEPAGEAGPGSETAGVKLAEELPESPESEEKPEEEEPAKPARQAKPARNRQHKGGTDRSAT